MARKRGTGMIFVIVLNLHSFIAMSRVGMNFQDRASIRLIPNILTRFSACGPDIDVIGLNSSIFMTEPLIT